MKLKKIKNIGCLKETTEELDLGSYAFIYGLNGAGKSTIKELFKNAFIDGSNVTPTFGVNKSKCEAIVNIFNKDGSYFKGVLNKPINGKVHVYDNEYVENSIYVNGDVSDNNKSEYYRLFVGDKVHQQINNLLETHKDMISDYNELVEYISKLKNTQQTIEQIQGLCSEIIEFCKTKFDLQFAVETTIKNRMKKNLSKISAFNVAWLKQGKMLQKDSNICPYCGQEINDEINEKLISHYTEIFNETQTILVDNKKNCERLKNQITSIVCEKTYYCDDSVFKEYKNHLLQLLLDKEKHINERVTPNSNFDTNSIKKGFDDYIKFISALEKLGSDMNITDVFSIKQVAANYSSVVNNDYNNIKKRIVNNVEDSIAQVELIKLVESICKKNIILTKGYNSIVKQQNDNISSNVDFINSKLKEYDFKYYIETNVINEKKLKTAVSPMLELTLVPNNYVSTGPKMTKKILKSVLSEGEKSILAWIFFLLDLRGKLSKEKHLIIIDDPISSYDSYRRFNLMAELEWIIREPATKEILLLSHEKSFTNVLGNKETFKTYIMKNGKLSTLNIKEIVESDFKHDVRRLTNFGPINTKEKMLEFMIISRNVIDYYKSINSYVDAKYFRKKEFDEMYSIASSIIHLQKNDLPSTYLNYIIKIMKRVMNGKVIFDIDTRVIDLAQLDLETCLTNITNVYLARVKINKIAIDLLSNAGVTYANTSTTGELINLVHEKKLISDEKYGIYKKFIPLLNVYNHVNDNYGLRRVDCDEIQMQNMYQYLNSNV